MDGAGEGLADGDSLAQLLLGEPLLFANHLTLHLPDEGDGAAEAEEAEAQVVLDEVPDGHALGRLFRLHRQVLLGGFREV